MKTIHAIIITALVAGLFAACASDEQSESTEVEATTESVMNTLTKAELDEGWILMFDGESVDGWRGYNRDYFPEGWVIEDGALRVIAGARGGDIIFDQKFQDFHLKLEWKASEGANSGIFYLSQELDGRPIWHSAPEMQILDNENHPDANQGIDENRQAGSLYDLLPAVPQNFRGHGEWNKAEVIVRNGSVTHRQNGETVVEFELGTPEWDAMVAASKFEPIEVFGIYQPGFIGLQDHNDDVWFRNLRILSLD